MSRHIKNAFANGKLNKNLVIADFEAPTFNGKVFIQYEPIESLWVPINGKK